MKLLLRFVFTTYLFVPIILLYIFLIFKTQSVALSVSHRLILVLVWVWVSISIFHLYLSLSLFLSLFLSNIFLVFLFSLSATQDAWMDTASGRHTYKTHYSIDNIILSSPEPEFVSKLMKRARYYATVLMCNMSSSLTKNRCGSVWAISNKNSLHLI